MPGALLLIYGMIEFGRALFIWSVLHFSAQEAARFAMVNYDATPVQIKKAMEEKFMLIDQAKILSFVVVSELNPSDQTRTVTINIDYKFSPIVPIGIGDLTISGHARGILVEDNNDLETMLAPHLAQAALR
jgi:hypothetical protein